MARLFSDENFPLPVVETLRHLGHDVLTIQESGHANRVFPDDEVLRYASSEDRAVLTLNRKHFIALHDQGVHHAGIVACTFDPDFDSQAERIDRVLRSHDSLARLLIRVNRPG